MMNVQAAMQAAQQNAQQQFYEYEDELDGEYDEEQEPLDDNGDPIPSPEEVRQIINSINSFKYQEPTPSRSSEKAADEVSEKAKESCAICLDDITTGQMVKALRCSHKFHEKCINNWLRQKLQCPLCKEKVTLAQ